MTSQIARLVPYKTVLDGFLRRRGYGRSNTPDEDDLKDAAEFITAAYKDCLDWWPWPETVIPRTLTIANGFVPWALVLGADNAGFWTADPHAPCSQAVRIGRTREDSTGITLDTTRTSVFTLFTPRAPEFRHVPVAPAEDYVQNDVVYDSDSGDMLLCLAEDGAEGSAITDPEKWQPLRLLHGLADPAKLLALADALGNGEHERAQAGVLRGQAMDKLAQLSTQQQMQSPPTR